MRSQKAKRTLLVVMLLASTVALAQAPMTSYYGSYDNVTVTTDSNGIIASVTLTNTLSGYADYTYFDPPYHQGHAYVSLGGIQGWDDSDWVPADYSMYLEASATLNSNASCFSSQCSISGSTEVDCTMAGLFYSGSLSDIVRITNAYWGPPVSRTGDTCYWGSLACSSGTATCTTGIGVIFVPSCPNYVHAKYAVIGGTCLGISLLAAASGPGPCD